MMPAKEDMIRCCEALGQVKTTYGVYYVFGNHGTRVNILRITGATVGMILWRSWRPTAFMFCRMRMS